MFASCFGSSNNQAGAQLDASRRAEIDDLKAKIAESAKTIDDLTAKKTKYKTEANMLKARVNEYETEVGDLKLKSSEYEADVHRCNAKYADLKEKNHVLEVEVRSSADNAVKLEEANANFEIKAMECKRKDAELSYVTALYECASSQLDELATNKATRNILQGIKFNLVAIETAHKEKMKLLANEEVKHRLLPARPTRAKLEPLSRSNVESDKSDEVDDRDDAPIVMPPNRFGR